MQADYAATCARANAYGSFVNQQLTQTGLATRFPENNSLAEQLAVVARLVANRRGLGLKRQVFFVGMGGFDTRLARPVDSVRRGCEEGKGDRGATGIVRRIPNPQRSAAEKADHP